MTSDPPIRTDTAEEASELLDQGRALLKKDQHQDALAIADRLLKDFEKTPEALLFASDVHFTRANFVGSEQLANQCSDRFREDFGGPIFRCRALQALGKLGEAKELALAMAAKEITVDSHFAILVTVLSGCMVPEAAYPLCKKSVKLDPENPAAHRRLALTCRLIGKVDEAVAAANMALRFNSHDYEMIGLRSVLRTVTAEDNHIAELQALLTAGCRSLLGAARVTYALAKEYEETGDYERSFKVLEAGAKFKRQSFNYTINDDLQTFQSLQETFSAAALAGSGSGFDTKEPIFILGLPRTGSTLVERIISSHSAVYAAGELNLFSTAMMEEIRKLGPLVDRADLVKKSLQADSHAVGRRYLELTRPATGHTPHFIDKLPLNSLSIGVISLALPNAKIIHLRRTPLDACYAIYKFMFNQAYSWSYDMDEIAKFYIGYRQLMEHWRTVLPGRVMDVTYENIVANLEEEARQIIADIGLEWEAACLDFHKNKAAAMTGSAVQVRQKIYSSSVGRWRDYEAQLKPLADALEAAGIDPFNP